MSVPPATQKPCTLHTTGLSQWKRLMKPARCGSSSGSRSSGPTCRADRGWRDDRRIERRAGRRIGWPPGLAVGHPLGARRPDRSRRRTPCRCRASRITCTAGSRSARSTQLASSRSGRRDAVAALRPVQGDARDAGRRPRRSPPRDRSCRQRAVEDRRRVDAAGQRAVGPPPSPSRAAQKASETGAGAWRTSRLPWSATARSSTSARAPNWACHSAAAVGSPWRGQRSARARRPGAGRDGRWRRPPGRTPPGTPAASRAPSRSRAARRARRHCPSPPRCRTAARRGRAAAGPTPRRSRCRPGTPATRRRARRRACRPSTSRPRSRGDGSRGCPRRRRGPRAWPSPWPPRTRARGRRGRWPSPAGRRAAPRTRCGGGVVHRLEDAVAHRAGRADQAVQARVVDHPDDRGDAAALLADEPGADAAELDLGRRQRARAELLLEALELHAGAALDQEARRRPAAGLGLGEHEEHVARRVGAEPLVAPQLVVAVADVDRAGEVGAHVGAALALGHRHTGDRGRRRVGRGEARLPLGRQLRRAVAQGRDHGVGHRDRARDAEVGGAEEHERRGADGVGAGAFVGPRQRVQAAPDAVVQQPVPGGVELDLVDPVAVAVVGDAGRARCGPRGGCARLLGAGGLARGRCARSTPQPPPSRPSASRSGRSSSKRSTGPSGGGWFRTSRVEPVRSVVAIGRSPGRV